MDLIRRVDRHPPVANRVQIAAHHWQPRFVANGIDVNDFENVLAKTVEWKDWGPNWHAMGGVHEDLGREAEAQDAWSLLPPRINERRGVTTSASSCGSRTWRCTRPCVIKLSRSTVAASTTRSAGGTPRDPL